MSIKPCDCIFNDGACPEHEDIGNEDSRRVANRIRDAYTLTEAQGVLEEHAESLVKERESAAEDAALVYASKLIDVCINENVENKLYIMGCLNGETYRKQHKGITVETRSTNANHNKPTKQNSPTHEAEELDSIFARLFADPTVDNYMASDAKRDIRRLYALREQSIKEQAVEVYHNDITDNEKKVWIYRDDLEKRKRKYLESVMRDRARTNPDMTIKEFYEGQFQQKMTLTAQNSATFHSINPKDTGEMEKTNG